MGRRYALPRETLLLWCRKLLRSAIKLKANRRTRSAFRTEGGRFTGSTYEAGPMKPGNSVEDKTLTTKEQTAKF